MEANMIRIEDDAKMTAAIARCRKAHPKVRRIDASHVLVSGSKGAACTVTLAEPKAGLKLAARACTAITWRPRWSRR
ncbi:MAG: hypothetical protein ACKV2V_09235 [Blastocatellia bacterium]